MSWGNPNGSFTIPNVCAHGTAWSLPCAACNRPQTYSTAPLIDASALRDLAAALRDLAAAIRASREEPRP